MTTKWRPNKGTTQNFRFARVIPVLLAILWTGFGSARADDSDSVVTGNSGIPMLASRDQITSLARTTDGDELQNQNYEKNFQIEDAQDPKMKKWSAPHKKNKARVLYNYLVARRPGNDIFGKRMESGNPTRNFRFFKSGLSGSPSRYFGSEFLGKRGHHFGDDSGSLRVSEFVGKRSELPEKRSRASEFLGKRARVSEFLGKRARVSEFLGKRANSFWKSKSPGNNQRARVSKFLGKRSSPVQTYAKRPRVSEFLGKRSEINFEDDEDDFYPNETEKRSRIPEFLGKRYMPNYDENDSLLDPETYPSDTSSI